MLTHSKVTRFLALSIVGFTVFLAPLAHAGQHDIDMVVDNPFPPDDDPFPLDGNPMPTFPYNSSNESSEKLTSGNENETVQEALPAVDLQECSNVAKTICNSDGLVVEGVNHEPDGSCSYTCQPPPPPKKPEN